jgi:hypothetical protein
MLYSNPISISGNDWIRWIGIQYLSAEITGLGGLEFNIQWPILSD